MAMETHQLREYDVWTYIIIDPTDGVTVIIGTGPFRAYLTLTSLYRLIRLSGFPQNVAWFYPNELL